MDTKRLMTMMMLSFAIIFGWQLIVAKMYEAHPEWKRPGQTSTPTTAPAVATTSPATTTTTTHATASRSYDRRSIRASDIVRR